MRRTDNKVERGETMKKTDRDAHDDLLRRLESEAIWSDDDHEYVLPHGSTYLLVGNAAALGVQLRALLDAYPRMFAAVRRYLAYPDTGKEG